MSPYRLVGCPALLALAVVCVACKKDGTGPSPGPGNVSLTSIAPDTLVEGQSATLTGSGFSPTPANNTVTIGGVAAGVTAASQTSLTVTVPASNCQPARDAGVSVSVGGLASNSVTKRVHPAAFLSLAVGEQMIIQHPDQFCLQFRASAAGGDAYLVGVGASAESPTANLPFRFATVSGAAVGEAATAVQRLPEPAPAGPAFGGVAQQDEPLRRSQLLADLRLREWERRHLGQAGLAEKVAPVARKAPTAVPNVGDTIRFRIAKVDLNPCDTVRSVLTRVKVVGAAGIWVTDINNPPTDSLTTAEIQAYSDTFDVNIYAVDTLYFGTPSDIDANQRVFIVLSIEVNKLNDVAGFVFNGDLFSRSQCTSSNLGEIFYGHVPDPNNVGGTGARTKESVLDFMPALVAHEFTHTIQFSRRLFAGGTFLTLWEMEGQAVLAQEVVGHSVLGNTPGQNYGAGVALGAGLGARWYGNGLGPAPFKMLALYYGWVGGTSKADNAPEQCTLFGSVQVSTTCSPFAFYGASWALQRYISDRFGPAYPGGETGLNRDLIGKHVGLSGVANIEGLGLTVGFDSLFSQWSAMLYADGRVAGAPAALNMTSWNLWDVFSAFPSDAFRLIPTERTFATFTDSRSVRGGSNAYTRLSAAGAHPALAIRVRDPGDAALSATLKPQLWVVRLQ